MKTLANFVGYQLVWFAVVGTAGGSRPWLGFAAAAAFIALQMALSTHRALDARLLILALLLGVSIDGTLSALGWIRYSGPTPALPAGGAPLWILALWTSFSLTLTRSLAWLSGHPLWAAAFGAIGGPIAYWSAARGFDAVRFVPPSFRAITALAAGWSGAMTLLFFTVRRWERSSPAVGACPNGSTP